MNKFLISFLFIACHFIAACGNNEPKNIIKEIRMSISSDTGITYSLFDNNKENPIECMLVMTEDNPSVWQPLAFGAIEGFTYEQGHEYYLRVKKTTFANPPADASDTTYSLIEILMDKLMIEPETPVDKDMTTESD